MADIVKDDLSIASAFVQVPTIELPQVFKATLCTLRELPAENAPLILIRKAYRANGFWDEVKKETNPEPLSPAEVINQHNSLINDESVKSQLTESEKATLKHIKTAAEEGGLGSNIAIGQTILFKTKDLSKKILEFRRALKCAFDRPYWLVIATKNLAGETIIAKLKQGDQKVLVDVDSTIDFGCDDKRTTELKVIVDQYHDQFVARDKDNNILNKSILKDHAIAPIMFKDYGLEDKSNSWADIIKGQSGRVARLYIEIDAYKEHSKTFLEPMIRYHGDKEPQQWWNGKGKAGQWIELGSSVWIDPVINPQKSLFNYKFDDEKMKSGLFGWTRTRPDGTKKAHQGNDIFAPIGTDVFACLDGEINLVINGTSTSYGREIHLQVNKAELSEARNDKYARDESPDEWEHAPDFDVQGETRVLQYAHLDTIVVKAGDKVVAGQKIGTTGKSGTDAENCDAKARHLHFEIRSYTGKGVYGLDKRTNPAFYVNWVSSNKEVQMNNKD